MAEPTSSSTLPSTPLPTSSSRTPHIIAAAVTAAAALGAGILFAVVSSGSAGDGGGSRRAFRSEGAIQEPRQAVVEALEAIRGGRCKTCGELVFFLRGPPQSPVSPAAFRGVLGAASATASEKLPPSNAHCLRVPASVLHYIQESYLPATRRQLVEAQQKQQPSPATPALQVEYNLFAQMVAADVTLRALSVERATPFDKDNRSHMNLLQQLWMAAGKPATTYSPLGQHWASIGFQGVDPVTDLRGGGVLALRQLVHFAQAHNTAFREMLAYNERVQREGKHSWYLLAVVSIQLTTQLMLEQDHPLHVAHLEMIYDTLCLGAAGDATAKAAGRRAVAGQKGVRLGSTRAADTAAFWEFCKSARSAEAGMFALHHALLLHFKECWTRDEPHVMEYNTYMSAKVFSTFFTTKWADKTLTAP
ncbi:conserved hypothetical protein [Leishmania infantum JPCM5]|uniref:Engulfment_and_cell_motility_domain_2_-_putative n=2 Tax=Leishmania infantum TaxID=5671 RepID=A0A6L0XII6_LEIIN|nr:conserved hypothetical protein [Leishmania infantum JPCM5]CAC9497224.1 engulfment_and_cell_motility_domain_2_-_putative [Leishmania infantum]CAM68860.1 conserved hypothetical protein [Leishmania infantum JPCM5]SUZ42778.1 engulfment_and_cell_motility_domain_2_-_putative [Leishmania infantum]|eukprot:XP_001470484.1 conserved hypothetical protein [Leishmania infantum JPCM5]